MAIQTQLFANSNLGFPMCGYSQDLMIDNGLAQSCFNSQQDLRHLYNDRQRSHDMFVDTNLLFSSNNRNKASSSPPPSIPQSLNLQLEKQNQDMDRYIRLQNEELRLLLQEQRKQQVASLLKKVETDAIHVLRQKDEEIARATMRRTELEVFLTRLEEENQAWRKEAEEKEAMVLSLYNTLEHVKERALYGFNNNGVAADDAGSSCYNEEKEEDVEVEESRRKMVNCKRCKCGKACVLFLPCRHLCSCKECEGVLQACPVCRMPKKATIETLIF